MNPDLQKCTVPSFMGALLKAAQSGLRPGMFGEGWIIPRWNGRLGSMEAQFQPGYMGLAQLAYRSGEVAEVHAVAVYAADHFRYQLGSRPEDRARARHGGRARDRRHRRLLRGREADQRRQAAQGDAQKRGRRGARPLRPAHQGRQAGRPLDHRLRAHGLQDGADPGAQAGAQGLRAPRRRAAGGERRHLRRPRRRRRRRGAGPASSERVASRIGAQAPEEPAEVIEAEADRGAAGRRLRARLRARRGAARPRARRRSRPCARRPRPRPSSRRSPGCASPTGIYEAEFAAILDSYGATDPAQLSEESAGYVIEALKERGAP